MKNKIINFRTWLTIILLLTVTFGYFTGINKTTNVSQTTKLEDGYVYSDSRVKTNVTPYNNGLSVVKQLNTVKYRYNGLAGSTDDGKEHIGVLAQDLQAVAPNLVSVVTHTVPESKIAGFSNPTLVGRLGADSLSAGVNMYNIDVLSINQNELIYVLIDAVKELEARNSSLQARIEALESR